MKRLWIYAIVAVCALSFASCGCEHVYGEWETVTTSTCSTAGVEAHTCSECGEVEERALALLEHTYGDWTVSKEATCTEKGEETLTCAECGQAQTRETDMIEHTYGEWVVSEAATCTEKGEDTSVCTVCGQTQMRETEMIDHNYSYEVIVKETCTTNGQAKYTCDGCGDNYDEDIKAGHNWIDATCTSPKTCSVCKKTEGKALGHNFKDGRNCSRCKAVSTKWMTSDMEELCDNSYNAANIILDIENSIIDDWGRKIKYGIITEMEDSYDVYNSDSNRRQLKTAFMYISLVQKLVNNRDSYALGEKYAKYSYLKDFKTLKDLVDRTYKYCKECVELTVTKDTYSDYHSKMSIMMDYLERIHSIGMDMMSDQAFDMLENL